jgi:tetratricopeptide (TPR) repeat protein
LYKGGSEEPLVYEALYKIKSDSKFLEEGRAKFPSDKGLMFALINEKIQSGDMAAAKNVLEDAIKADPENISVYVTAGSVAERTGDMESAKKYYEQALAKDENNFDATYSVGALYYNQAAGMTEKLNELANDYSKAGTAKYDAAKAEMDALFDKALPFFTKAEGINGDDMNTLVALKEIYARKNMLTESTKYKELIESKK